MSHLPVDHPLRGFYRGLCVLTGLVLIVFGVIALNKTSGMDMFAQEGKQVIGLSANPALALSSLVMGILIVVFTLIGRNVDVVANIIFASIFVLVGLAALALLRTDANYLAFSVANVNVVFVIATILATAAMYSTMTRHKR